MKQKRIGIFDSGVGGLTVLYQLLKYLPNENYVYFGDTARVPYGTKSKETIINFSRQNINFLLTKDVKIIVVACNSASSNGIELLKKEYDIPIFDVITPTVKGIKNTQNIGIIGTYATIESGSYKKKLYEKLSFNVNIFEKPCPLFVPIAEEGLNNTNISKLAISFYLEEFKRYHLDQLILGCTHYPLFQDEINNFFNGKIKLINPGEMVAQEVKEFLIKNDLLNPNGKGNVDFYLSDIPRKFHEIVKRFLGKDVKKYEKIDIERY